MLTSDDIRKAAQKFYDDQEFQCGWEIGAGWANKQNEKELATLRAENARLREALETALAEGMKTRAGRDVVRNALDFELPDRL